MNLDSNFPLVFGLLVTVILLTIIISIYSKLNNDIIAINNTISSIYTPSSGTLSVSALNVNGQSNMNSLAITGKNRTTQIFNDPGYGGYNHDPGLHITSGEMDATINYNNTSKVTGMRLGVGTGSTSKASFYPASD
jgi:hypothetical protein